jgi:hypothetical protein
MKYPTLFIKDKGRLRVWRANVKAIHDDLGNETGLIKIEYGLYGGKITVKTTFVTEGKNLGKSNETNPYDQACLNVESIIRDQRNDGYRSFEDYDIEVKHVDDPELLKVHNFQNGLAYLNTNTGHLMSKQQALAFLYDNLPEIKLDNYDNMKPMILHHLRLTTYDKDSISYKKSKVPKFPVFVQPKKDGVHCLARPTGPDNTKWRLFTRQGKESLVKGGEDWSDICPQIVQALEALNWNKPINGEVYKYGLDLGTITDSCKKADKHSQFLQLHIFDIVDLTKKQSERYDDIGNLYMKIRILGLEEILDVIPTDIAYNWNDLLRFEKKWLEHGEEGIVVRNFDGMYEPGTRSADVLKLVRFDSCEVEIVDIVSMENEPTHGMFVCKVNDPIDLDHAYFNVTPSEFDHHARQHLLIKKDEYIGRFLTINHRGFTRYNVPRIATAKSICYDK